MKKEIWLLGIVALVCGAIGVFVGLHKWQDPSPPAGTSHYFFNQALPDLENNNKKLSEFQGKLLLVNFWATWCAPCVEEMPELSALHDSAEFKNLQVVGIGIDSANNMKEFAGKYKISYPIYVAGMAGIDMAKKMGNQQGGLPFTILFAPDGSVKKTYLGRLNMETVRKDLASFS
ncbi:thiol-disulfide isomerase/thioredoxin [Paucimonas lemoignei]|uniref:Thiol-disulfide isomerase/thioredoxin n=1 Tax=Paucimonas lemoignei TaxID=29443 RepID=A0A4R3HUY1_PAULE|nr:TlpA disulfide reductase family protein [Paucimonas lemoignei]TCS36878.1 thiol-disulfide isomerase/thioredoxin [Paucimonas lemoignei]